MFFQTTPIAAIAPGHAHDALAACITLFLIGCLVYAFSHAKPTTQRVLLRLMFQPVLATTLFFTLWLTGILFSILYIYTHTAY